MLTLVVLFLQSALVSTLRNPGAWLKRAHEEQNIKLLSQAKIPVATIGSCRVQVYQLFLEIDANGDGIIDTKELRKGLKKFGFNLTDAEVEQLMLRMDLNHDGTVDFSELAASLIDWQVRILSFHVVTISWLVLLPLS